MRKWFNKKSNTNNERSGSATNSSQQRVYSYYTASRRQIDQFERNNQQHLERTNTNRQIALGAGKGKMLILGILIIVLLASLVLSNSPSVIYNGPRYQDTKTSNASISNIINQDKRNLFKPSLQSETIKQEILKTIPEANNVEVYAPLIGFKPIISIQTNQPFAVLIQPSANSLIIDQSGRAVAQVNNTNLDASSISVIENQTGLEYSINDQIFSPNEIDTLLVLHNQLQQEGGNKQISYIMPSVPREIRLKRAGYYVKFGLDDSSGAGTDLQYGSLKSIEKSIQEQGTAPPSEYIDVRLSDKVYLK